jgi:hypothetical protein
VVKERGARVEQKLALVRAASETIQQAPLLTRDEPVDLTATFSMYAGPPAPGNAALIYLEDLARLDELSLVYARMDGSKVVATCASFVGTERYPWDAQAPESAPSSGTGYSANRYFDVCEKLDTLFVVRTRALAKPSPGKPSAGEQKRLEFEGGFIDTDVLVFDLAAKKQIGGLRVSAESDEKLDGASAFEVEFDLQYNLQKALVAKLKQHMPKVSVPGGPR